MIQGNYAYLMTQLAGSSQPQLEIIDISDPYVPELIAVEPLLLYTAIRALVQIGVQGNYVYAIASSDLIVVDVRNPLAPVSLPVIELEATVDWVPDLAFLGEYAIFMGLGSEVSIMDLRQPDMPSFHSAHIANGEGMTVSGNLAAVAYQAQGFRIYDSLFPLQFMPVISVP